METIADIHEIRTLLPHRYPFLLVDRVVEFEPHKRLVGLKNVTVNEPHFQGHFPVRPVMPGVLIVEALAQASGLLAFLSVGRHMAEENLFYLVSVDNARFKRPVEPGDQLILDVTLLRTSRRMWKFATEARVGDATVASAELMCAERGDA